MKYCKPLIAMLSAAAIAVAVPLYAPCDSPSDAPVVIAASVVTPAAIPSIDGPDSIPAGKPAWFSVTGVSGTASAAFLPTALLDTSPSRVVAGNALFWAAEPGTYVLTAIVVDWDARRFTPLSKQVTVTGDPKPNPQPNPGPDPQPVPGERFVLVISESRDRTPQETATLTGLRRWMDQAKLNYRILDPTTEASWAAPYKAEIERRKVSLPALTVVVPSSQSSDGAYLAVKPLPATSAEAIEIIEEALK